MASARLVVLLLGIFFTPAKAELSSRIWGGTVATKNSFPHVVSIRLDGAHACGGSIIWTKSILTSAHCLMENGHKVSLNRLTVRVGSTNKLAGGKLYYVSSISIHPKYDGKNNDIAVLLLELLLEWSSSVALVDFAIGSFDEPKPGDFVTVAGWGEQSSNEASYKLHSMSFTLTNQSVCSNVLGGMDISKICLAHNLKEGSCTGDSGNGAFYKNKLIGVSSFIIGSCGSRFPDVFSRVVHYKSWIEKVID